MSPCMKGSLAKAACNNDDSLDCNKLDFLIELNKDLFEAGGKRCS